MYADLKNPDLDRRAREMFANGLGFTSEAILRQVKFIGDRPAHRGYGGVAGYPSAIRFAPDIAKDIFERRAEYEHAASSALPILRALPSRSTVETLYRPFIKPLREKDGKEKSHWQAWATKFWHFLNPDAFPIEDSRVNSFFVITGNNSVEKYLRFANKFREYTLSHQGWLPQLRQVDGGLAWCDNKLWDKMCYGLGEEQFKAWVRAEQTKGRGF